MKIKINILVAICILTYCANTYAIDTVPIFTGSVKESGLPDVKEIAIQYFENWYLTGHKYVPVKVNSNGDFKFELPDYKKPYKFDIGLRRIDGSIYFGSGGDGRYYVESGDNVRIRFIKNGQSDSISFTGHGSEKYNLVEKLNYWKAAFQKERPVSYFVSEKDSNKLKIQINETANWAEKSTDYCINLINRTAGINPEMKDIIKQEYLWWERDFLSNLDFLYRRNSKNPIMQNILQQNFNTYKGKFYLHPNALSYLCPLFIGSLVEWEHLNLLHSNNSEQVTLKNLYQVVSENYSGLVKEMMLARIIIHPPSDITYSPSDFDYLVDDLMKNLSTSFLKEAVTELVRLKKGANVFDGVFTKIDGQKLDLKSLHGKAVLIDVWFLGCSGCANFHQRFHKEIYPLLKAKRFVYLSINIDKAKQNWIKGIASGLYTSNEYTNVSTNGLGLDNLFMKYYNIKGAPTLLLLDSEGKIYGQPTQNLTNHDVSLWINEALKTKTEQ